MDRLTGKKFHFDDVIEMEQQPEDHLIYFNSGDKQKRFFKLLNYHWDGPKYEEYIITNNEVNENVHTHRTHHLLGALAGDVLAGGLGAVIGGVAGLGSKSDVSSSTTSTSTPETEEVPAKAKITLEDASSHDVFTVDFMCTSDLDQTFKKFYVFKGNPDPDNKNLAKMDPFEEMEKMKKMLDEGIISQEEFDRKKKELLGV